MLPKTGNLHKGINSCVWTVFIVDLEIANKSYVHTELIAFRFVESVSTNAFTQDWPISADF